MKFTPTLTVLVASCLILVGCQKEITEKSTKSPEIIAQMGLSPKKQKPVSLFDSDKKKGIYHGLIASGNTQDRGKIWINIGNNTSYDAYAEMVNGTNIKFVGTTKKNSPIYEFKSEEGSFIVDVSGEEPTFSEVNISGNKHYIMAYKHTSKNNVKIVTGRFHSPDKQDLKGTWSLLSDGNVVDPNGHGGEAITSVVVTMGGQMMVDNNLELINGTCIPLPDAIPQLSDNSDSALIGAYNQVSDFNGETKWSLVFCLGHYLNTKCKRVDSGTFEWTSTDGATHNGIIYVDDLGV